MYVCACVQVCVCNTRVCFCRKYKWDALCAPVVICDFGESVVDHNQLRNDILRKMLSITGIKICIVPESLLIIAVGSFIFGRA